MTGESNTGSTSSEVAEWLKDGQVLCRLINILQPGSVKKINESKMAFKQVSLRFASIPCSMQA